MATDLKTLERQRAAVKGKLTRLSSTIDDANGSVEFKNRLESLSQIEQQFDAIQFQIEGVDESTDHNIARGEFESKVLELSDRIKRKLSGNEPVAVGGRTATRSETPNAALHSLMSRVKIQMFSGECDEWASFHDTFKSVVHDDESTPAVHKFQVLKSHLCGPIASVMADLPATEENYYVAWEMLIEECSKPRLAIHAHLKAIIEYGELTRDCPVALKKMVREVDARVRSLKGLQVPVEYWDDILVFIVTRKLDRVTRRAWDQGLENEDRPSFPQLMAFLKKQARTDDVEPVNKPTRSSSAGNKGGYKGPIPGMRKAQTYAAVAPHLSCVVCTEEHAIWKCAKFLRMSIGKRYEVVQQARLCLNCLKKGHPASQCLNSGCRKCTEKHSTLLHVHETHVQEALPTSSESNAAETGHTTLTAIGNAEVLLGTARVLVLDKDNREHECRALLDSCSQNNFITEELATKLGLPRKAVNLNLSGIGQTTSRSTQLLTTILKSRRESFSKKSPFFILNNITSAVPSRQIAPRHLKIPKNVKLADPEFHKPGRVDILLGNQLFFQALSVGQIRLSAGSILQKTRLGNVDKISGQCYLAQTSVEKQLRKFWEVEEIVEPIPMSAEQAASESHYLANTCRDPSGRYVVRLPFRDSIGKIGESYTQATRRFSALERRLKQSPELREQYINFLREYESLGHMQELADTSEERNRGYYMPHHAVVKSSSLTTKLRVVFDASAKTSTGVSLNDTLLTGPTIQDDLFSIVSRFRTHAFVIAADIEKMYRQIRVHDDDANFQKILWREHPSVPVKTFKLTTVTYGTTSAPYLAIRTLHQLANDEGHRFPLAAEVFKGDFYVDDLLTGCDSRSQARQVIGQLTSLAALGGFKLRQWVSNEPSLIQELDSAPNIIKDFEPSEIKKTLGISWDARSDTIRYSVANISNHRPITKRTVLSELARIFDPLGLLGPVIIAGKIFMQTLWTTTTAWDESLPQELSTVWYNFRRDLPELTKIEIPRRIIIEHPVNIEMHGFADASQKAYGAVLYLRSTTKGGETIVRIVCAKSRVAPLKSLSLPRLELCAAALLARLYQRTAAALKIEFGCTQFWTDSTIVLQWIRMSPHLLKTFVANRVSEIQRLSEAASWSHVSSRDNPADFISRGQGPIEFRENEMWFNGPTWLVQERGTWPKQLLRTDPGNVPETRVATALVSSVAEPHLFERFSDISRLNRFVAYCRRWLIPANRTRGRELTTQEIQDAHLMIIGQIQTIAFTTEIQALRVNREIHIQSKLRRLNPFLDDRGVLRVGGRLKHAPISYDAMHPMILPRAHHVTQLIVTNEHVRCWHAGTQGTLSSVRQRYWPIDGRNLTRRIIHSCIRCFRCKPIAFQHIMGNLPHNRVTTSRPFCNVGLDYCGPIYIKEKKLRNKIKLKAYVAVFVCLATKAIHLELVSDLSADTCLACIKRFCARRGKPTNIYSDNATNFVGSRNEMAETQSIINAPDYNSKINRCLAVDGIEWHFSPPRSPHFGGLWGAAVKSFKSHLRRTIGDALFTFEQLNTCMIEIEAILNSRPLTPISTDPNDLIALSPSHFLIGDNMRTVPEHYLGDVATNRLSQWQHVQQVKQHFWSRWQRDYLHELHTRSKWHVGNLRSVPIGTMVLLKEENTPVLQWRLGRITEIHPGDDGIVRVATVKTCSGSYKRSIRNLCPLPLEPDPSSDASN